ncbi:Transcription repressor OFP8 [Hibiscus syriacus]|uniref:Transcription repressor n=1 Tax=Hibiscus syriacus TaxID=106335 RepID=A0A6A3CHP6_HIBSY|nr:transcription repressor OFP6-like [Hibiscus syriacus]KAE8726961.1 Transcription repressor OFP8 [Hibiscus syriacus]
MFSSRKKPTLNTVSVSLGCGGCKKSKLASFFNPKPKPKSKSKPRSLYTYSSSSSYSKTATSFSPSTDTPQCSDVDTKCSTATVRGFRLVGGESMAVEKDSDDPYLDFRHSMLQMILEKEIYSKDGLRELLNCFLQLNSPYYHGVIIKAFTEIWNGVFSVKHGGGGGGAAGSSPTLHFGFGSRDL